MKIFLAPILVLLGCTITCPLLAEDIRVDLDKRDDPHVKSRIDATGFAIQVEVEGYLQKLEPKVIRLETQQKGRWIDPKLVAGRYLKTDFDSKKPETMTIETTLKFDLEAGERRFAQEREAVQREAQKRTGGKDGAVAKARTQLLLERIAALREENIKAGAAKHGKATLHAPPLPRQALNFEKPDAIERLLKEQCCWQSVAEVFKATAFSPPDEKEFPDFAASLVMAEEIRQAMMGIRFTPRYLSESQYKALEQGSHFVFASRFVPELSDSTTDTLWRNAPAVRLADGLVKRAALEGGLNRERGSVVAWWRVACETPNQIQPQMAKGDGDCFWTWVETPDAHVRYLRFLLHSPETRYRMNLSLIGAAKGEELTLYDGPFDPPAKGPF